MKIALVGCGKISDIYIQNIQRRFRHLELVSCCAAHLESAQRKAEQYGLHPCTYEEILQDPAVEMVLILTPAHTHYGLIRQALEHGKHVYTEKTITLEVREARELAQLAEDRGLYLGSAPETFLGSAVQTAKKAIEDGILGQVTSFHFTANRNADILHSFFAFLNQKGGNICFDYGVYYLTALVYLLGPVETVYGELENPKPRRINVIPQSPNFGKEYDSPNETLAHGVLKLASGVRGTMGMNAESVMRDLADFRIYGTKGVLLLPDPNQFGGDVRFIANDLYGKPEPKILEPVSGLSDNLRGIGPAEMALAIGEKRPCLTDCAMATHVLDIVESLQRSSETGVRLTLETVCPLQRRPGDLEAILKL